MRQITIKVRPNSKQNKVETISPNELKVHLTSAPEKGKANQQLIKLLAKHLQVKKSQINITHGHTSSTKTITVS